MTAAGSPAGEGQRPLVSVCVPVRNGAEHLPGLIASIQAQTYEDFELVISDNASTDETEAVCREAAAADGRIVYHQQPENVGLLNNFVSVLGVSRGTFIRWVGHDDWLPPESIARSVDPLLQDDRRILATTRVTYIDEAGVARTDDSYDGVELASDDPIVRFREMLRLLNESSLLVDPLYGLFRRSAVSRIPRRNMAKEDEVFAAKLAVAGPWAHVPEVLLHRRTRSEPFSAIVRRLDLPAWQAHFAGALQCRELVRWLSNAPLTPEQRRQARAAVWNMYVRRQRRTLGHRTRNLARSVARVGRREA